MKTVILAVAFVALCSPAFAQLGGLLKKAQEVGDQIGDQKKKLDDLTISAEEERKIGEEVSAKIRQRFGVVQDPAVHKYVTLVGTLLARQSERPALAWTFIVLDTDGVNAFASPGGFVHVTRGALGLIRNEAELAGVLAHEIGHVAHKHTVNAIQKNNAVKMGTAAMADRAPFLDQLANKAYEMVLENAFDRGDEADADKASVQYTQKAGYASGTLADFLTRLDDRNKDQPARNGLFASHPETKERIEKIRQQAGTKTTAVVEGRYKQHIKYEPIPITSIAAVEDGSAGLTGSASSKAGDKSGGKSKDKKAAEEPKKKGFGLGNLNPTVAPESKSAQVSASGGARGVGPDRAARGGGNATVVKVAVSEAELEAFKKGIA